MNTNRLSSARRRPGAVAARAWLPRLLLGLTATALMVGSGRAVDLDPVLRGKWPRFGRGPASGVTVSGNYAYLAAESGGLQVIDISDPANPQRVGGNWSFDGRAVFVGSDHVFVAADSDGLMILHPFTPLTGSPLSLGRVQASPTGMDLALEGLPGLRVDIERSSDLHHWQSWTNTLLDSSPVELTDPEANPRQFYRAIAR